MDVLSIRFLKIIYSCKVGLSVCVARAAAWGGGAFLQIFSKNFGAKVQSVSQCPPCLLYYSCVPGNTKTTNECERRIAMYCLKCGYKIPAGAAFCPNCGARFFSYIRQELYKKERSIWKTDSLWAGESLDHKSRSSFCSLVK